MRAEIERGVGSGRCGALYIYNRGVKKKKKFPNNCGRKFVANYLPDLFFIVMAGWLLLLLLLLDFFHPPPVTRRALHSSAHTKTVQITRCGKSWSICRCAAVSIARVLYIYTHTYIYVREREWKSLNIAPSSSGARVLLLLAWGPHIKRNFHRHCARTK